MRRTVLVALLFAIAVTMSGCGFVDSVLRAHRASQVPVADAPIPSVDPPNPTLASDPIVASAAHSVVRIHSTATTCQKILEGSGVVIAPNRVMSSAHVVAGAESFTVTADEQERDATVVLFDPDQDIAILDVPGLPSGPLTFAEEAVATGTDALVMGYPGGGPFIAAPARVREVIQLNGPDIYRTKTVQREVYVIRGKVGQGDSGGPLIDLKGRVLGINFGAAVDDADTGFVLTAKQVYQQMVVSAGDRQPVATGACIT
jgi:S1-C subfamily serine protease